MTKIGVFDSGIGGKSVANALQKALPCDEILFVDDSPHMPYGTKSSEDVFKLVCPKIEELIAQKCNPIVIACNTVTTTLISEIREKYTDVDFVGIEPMVKPAALLSTTGTIAVCATPATLGSTRYQWLKNEFAKNVKVLEPDCSRWASMIESNSVDRESVISTVNELCDASADVIVLGCTHYHWIEDLIESTAGKRAHILQPEPAIVARVKDLIAS